MPIKSNQECISSTGRFRKKAVPKHIRCIHKVYLNIPRIKNANHYIEGKHLSFQKRKENVFRMHFGYCTT